MNAIPLINNISKSNSNEKQLRQEINTSLVALKKEAGTLEGLINEAAQMLVTINNRIATLENDTVKKSDIVDVVQSGNMNPVTSNAVANSNAMPVDTVTSGNMQSVTSNAVYSELFKLLIDANNDPDNFPSDAMRIYRVRNYNIGWATNDGLIIHIPWSDNYARQIALDDESNWIAQRVKQGGTWLPWKVLYDVNEDDNFEDITSQLNLNLGVTQVLVCRKNNLVNVIIQGTYTGSPTYTTQGLISNLPDKYKTSIGGQTFAVVSYNTSQPYVQPSRIQVIDNHIDLAETDMTTGTVLRIGFIYMV